MRILRNLLGRNNRVVQRICLWRHGTYRSYLNVRFQAGNSSKQTDGILQTDSKSSSLIHLQRSQLSLNSSTASNRNEVSNLPRYQSSKTTKTVVWIEETVNGNFYWLSSWKHWKENVTFDEYTVSSRRTLLSLDFRSNNPQSILMSHAYA